MSARFKTIKYTLPSTAAVSVHTIFNSLLDTYVSTITARAAATNVAAVEWMDEASSPGGFIEAREAISVDLTNKFVRTSDFYFKGFANDIIYITILG